MKVLGALLAGGQSSRFGSDKAAALWQGRPLIDHCRDALALVADAVVICGRRHRHWPWLADRPAPGLGPLGGLGAALHHAANHGFDRVVCIGCDTPLIPRPLLRDLAKARDAVIVDDLPIIGGWPASLAPDLDRFIETDARRSMRGWAIAAGARLITAPSIANINAPGDLEQLDNG